MRLIEADELQAAGFPEQCFFNLNTPEDRMAAEGPSF
jgi:molybdopterin-guanine dinucleotide biosynthesis protein A